MNQTIDIYEHQKKIKYHINKTVDMIEQLQHLQNEIDSITLDNIKNNCNIKTIANQFSIISENIKDIRNGKKPY